MGRQILWNVVFGRKIHDLARISLLAELIYIIQTLKKKAFLRVGKTIHIQLFKKWNKFKLHICNWNKNWITNQWSKNSTLNASTARVSALSPLNL